MMDYRKQRRIKEETLVYSMIGCPIILFVVGFALYWSSLPMKTTSIITPIPVIKVYPVQNTSESNSKQLSSPNPSANKNNLSETQYVVKENDATTNKKSLNSSKRSSLENAIDELMKLTEEE